MGEIKQTNFRINQETADAFRAFCEENGMNQAQGFDHIMQVVEMDRAKAATPGRAVEIETFERYVKEILSAYLNSLEICNNAEARIQEQFASDMVRRDRTIDELREAIDQLQAEKENAEEAYKMAQAAKDTAEEKERTLRDQMEAAKKAAADKERINSMLASQLADAQAAADRCKGLEATVESLKEQVAEMGRQIEDQKKEAESQLQQAKLQEQLTIERSVIAKEREMNDKLREADKENAKLAAMIEQLQSQVKGLQERLDEKMNKSV